MKRLIKPGLLVLTIGLAIVVGILIGDGRNLTEQWHAWFKDDDPRHAFRPHSPDDPALRAALPEPDAEAAFPGCPLNALLKPDLTPQEQTEIIGQTLIDYWTTTRTLPNGTWEEVCAQLSGKNRQSLSLVPPGHPALGKDGFAPGKGQPAIRLHVVGSSNCAFQLIQNGPDRQPYTADDLIRNFPPDLVVK